MDSLQLMLTLTLFFRFNLATCPEKCKCYNGTKVVVCTGLQSIPNFDNASEIRVLEILLSNFTTIKKNDLLSLTKLSVLDINTGILTTLESGCFDSFRETVTEFRLVNHSLAEIPQLIFSSMPHLMTINLEFNKLQSLKENTFAHLPNLTKIYIEHNNLLVFNSSAFTNVSSVSGSLIIHASNNKIQSLDFPNPYDIVNLQSLELSNNNISVLRSFQFLGLPRLHDLSLENNLIDTIQWDAFASTSLTNSFLRQLNLADNKIGDTSIGAFRHLVSLTFLDLSGNYLTHVTDDTFKGMTTLANLYMNFMPYLESIGDYTFMDHYQLKLVQISNNPKLSYISPKAFWNIKDLRIVLLKNNSLTTFSEKLIHWDSVDKVELYPNPIRCDCNLRWMTDPSVFHNNTNVINEIKNLVCASPEEHSNHKVILVDYGAMQCGKLLDERETYWTRAKLGLLVAGLTCLCLTIVAIIIRFQRKIRYNCHHYFQYRRFMNEKIFTVETETGLVESDLEEEEMIVTRREEIV
ncbi:hypothetical protein CHS0354_040938 [Potamilus streckersoni]|uniref:LRRCT domain-containing protein n=1 Tax=Potamilus streckersoni TaxID=2493646 RepID=A0AAE0T801_9BIVA|nr:hypothetical protein CHS0354_040938 [Potamilus streckersoni]